MRSLPTKGWQGKGVQIRRTRAEYGGGGGGGDLNAAVPAERQLSSVWGEPLAAADNSGYSCAI